MGGGGGAWGAGSYLSPWGPVGVHSHVHQTGQYYQPLGSDGDQQQPISAMGPLGANLAAGALIRPLSRAGWDRALLPRTALRPGKSLDSSGEPPLQDPETQRARDHAALLYIDVVSVHALTAMKYAMEVEDLENRGWQEDTVAPRRDSGIAHWHGSLRRRALLALGRARCRQVRKAVVSAAWIGLVVGSDVRGLVRPVEAPSERLAAAEATGGALGLEAVSWDVPSEFGLQGLGQPFWCRESVEGPW
ncbi:hypothetical protein NDU88_004114 [Pleurodeles waltl]|uniref:Uncharacterized protein n=1 Tax=Pleurodeles waltl TaxID=8319 RepID=A0AAV7T6S5_PLEWA|nr:hypothetical protein NDU88_004114 [Pleurodeles waltl]